MLELSTLLKASRQPVQAHRLVPFQEVDEYLRLGWMKMPSYQEEAHVIWVCSCTPRTPKNSIASEITVARKLVEGKMRVSPIT